MVGTVRAARQQGWAGAAFAAGLASGAAAVFVSLGALGAAVSGEAVVLAALALAGAAVVSDALGLRVRPQVRLQVPEPWRRTMPLPSALFLYGLLLGGGLTTYVPATAAWALPALSLALGDLVASLAIAAGFAAGRALPVLVLAFAQYALHSVNHLIDVGEADPSWLGPANLVALVLTAVLLGWMVGEQREVRD